MYINFDGILLRTPVPFGPKRGVYKISDGDRVSSGDMFLDFVANKENFKFKYDSMAAHEFEPILSKYKKPFMEFTLTIGVTPETATTYRVYPGAMTYHMVRRGVYADIEFDLIEM